MTSAPNIAPSSRPGTDPPPGTPPARDRAGAPATGPWTELLTTASLWFFFFALFKLLGGFVVPINLFLCFLLIGHPIGVLVAMRYYRGVGMGQAVRDHLVVAALTIVFLFGVRHLHPEVPDGFVHVSEGFFEMLAFLGVAAAACFPWFVVLGVVEYGLLDAARRRGRPLSRTYAMLLAGVLSGLVGGYLFLPFIGTVGLLAIAFGCGGWVAFSGPRARAGVGLAAAAAVVVAATSPRVEQAFVVGLQPAGGLTARSAVDGGARILHAAWGKHAYVQILLDEAQDVVFGAYDNFLYWDVPTSLRYPGHEFAVDRLVISLLPDDGRLAIVGGGGGKQVYGALLDGRPISVDAFELEPEVIRFFTEIDPDANARVYLHPRVRAVAGEGRRMIRAGDARYDAIYLADPGTFQSYFKTVLMEGHFLHTREAYADYADALAEGGFVAVLVMRDLDHDLQISQRIVNVLEALGLVHTSVVNDKFRLVVATQPAHAPAVLERALAAAPDLDLEADPVTPDFSLRNAVPTDDRGGSYLYALYPLPAITWIFSVSATIAVIGLVVAVAFFARRRRRRGVAHPVSGPCHAALLGVSFVILQNAFILELAKGLLDLTDAVIVGTGLFLSASVVGAMGAGTVRRHRRLATFVHLFVGSVLVAALLFSAPGGLLLAVGAVFVITGGTLFPLLLDREGASALGVVFGLDSLGAALGTLGVLFVPVLAGVRPLSVAAVVLCAAVGAWVILAKAPRPEETPP